MYFNTPTCAIGGHIHPLCREPIKAVRINTCGPPFQAR